LQHLPGGLHDMPAVYDLYWRRVHAGLRQWGLRPSMRKLHYLSDRLRVRNVYAKLCKGHVRLGMP
jgi:hypothetical protein